MPRKIKKPTKLVGYAIRSFFLKRPNLRKNSKHLISSKYILLRDLCQ